MANYLYNGVELPPLPECSYRYVFLCYNGASENYQAWFITQTSIVTREGFGITGLVQVPEGSTGVVYNLQDDNTWDEAEAWTNSSPIDMLCSNPVWTNYDMMYDDGTLYLAASYPINAETGEEIKDYVPIPILAPVLDPLSMWLGWKAGNWVARQRGKAKPATGVYDDTMPIEWNNMAIKNNTSIELEGISVFKISDSIPTSDELTNCIIVGSNSEMGSLTFAFNSVENIGSIDVFLYTYEYAAEAIPVWILRVSENTDGYEPGLYFLDVFDDISVDYAMHYITFCLYNGVKMPDIETVWVDKQKYPYAFMEAEVSDNGTIARLYLTANPVQINASELSGLRIPAGGWVQYVCTTDPNIVVPVVGYNHWKDNMMTGENDMSFDAPEESGIAWANYDVFNTDGTLYLAASEPVPVYE